MNERYDLKLWFKSACAHLPMKADLTVPCRTAKHAIAWLDNTVERAWLVDKITGDTTILIENGKRQRTNLAKAL